MQFAAHAETTGDRCLRHIPTSCWMSASQVSIDRSARVLPCPLAQRLRLLRAFPVSQGYRRRVYAG